MASGEVLPAPDEAPVPEKEALVRDGVPAPEGKEVSVRDEVPAREEKEALVRDEVPAPEEKEVLVRDEVPVPERAVWEAQAVRNHRSCTLCVCEKEIVTR